MHTDSREYYRDPWNPTRVWEVSKAGHLWHLQQYVKGEPYGELSKVTREQIENMGILGYPKIEGLR